MTELLVYKIAFGVFFLLSLFLLIVCNEYYRICKGYEVMVNNLNRKNYALVTEIKGTDHDGDRG